MEDQALLIGRDDYGLITDLYQLTMAACYAGEGLDQRRASFELFVRRLPENFGYLIAMGLEQALEYLTHVRFTPEHIEQLQGTGIFQNAPAAFWHLLQTFRFTGDVWAVPEGTAIFANEPLLRVEAPLWQAQLVETYLLNTLNYQTLIATRAARLRDVAGPEAVLMEFGSRRAFSPQGALWAARAALAGGLNSTSNVLAALRLGRQPAGTMAHALVMAFTAIEGQEDEAFEAFQRYFPKAALLIDTYDTVEAARRLSQRMRQGHLPVVGVRLDSGDLAQLSQQVRSLLPDTTIFASGDLDEYEIAELKRSQAQINGYGIGTRLVTGAPVNGVYKLVDIDGIPIMKASSQKETYPGRKQIFRTQVSGRGMRDRLGLMDEVPNQNGQGTEQPLLGCVMQNGQRLQAPLPLDHIAQVSAAAIASLPPEVRQIEQPASFPVDISPALQQLTQQTLAKLGSPLVHPCQSV